MNNLFLLIATHYLADFGLQSEWMAKNKIPSQSNFWIHALAGHCFIHGLTVYLVTQNLILGCAEMVAHACTDLLKGKGKIGFHLDQGIHLLCRVLWWIISITLFK